MEIAAREDVGASSEDGIEVLGERHPVEERELGVRSRIDENVDVAVPRSFVASEGAEQIDTRDAEAANALSFALQDSDDVISAHH